MNRRAADELKRIAFGDTEELTAKGAKRARKDRREIFAFLASFLCALCGVTFASPRTLNGNLL
jgi:hypothetical protein